MRDIEATPPDAPATTLTNHAMLVVWGYFRRAIGLVKNLEETPIPQRKRVHTPQTKLRLCTPDLFQRRGSAGWLGRG